MIVFLCVNNIKIVTDQIFYLFSCNVNKQGEEFNDESN